MLLKSVLSAVIALASSAIVICSAKSLKSAEPPLCNDPSRERLEELWQAHGSWHESIMQLENMDQVVTTLRNISHDYVHIRHHALQSTACPFGAGSDWELARYNRLKAGKITLCPTHDLINYDENRIPATMFEKRCSCSTCGFLDLQKTGRDKSQHSASSTLGCRPILYHAKVLRRVNCVNNIFIYQPVMEPLVVACSCDHSETKEVEGGGGSGRKGGSHRRRPRIHVQG